MASFLSLCYTFLTLFALFIAKRLYALYNNYISARSLNLPIVVCFESFQDPLWMLIGPSVRKLFSCIGLWDPSATDYTSIGWSQNDRFASHAKYGPAFVIVSPFENNVMVTDKDAAQELFKNWRIWIKNQDIYSMFNAYGKNVNTVIGDDWPRHRKVTSHAFKEANSKLVWGATRKQMNSLIGKWKGGSQGREISLAEARADWEKLALHVLMSVGFRKEYEFETGVKVVEPGHKISFGEAMHTCIGSMALVLTPVIYAAARLPSFVIPAGLKRLQVSVEEVKSFLKSAVEDERKALKEGIQPGSNLISTLVQANEEEKKEGGKALALTDEELYGNLFLFNLAGHETTSSALGFAVPLLALYPEVQRWIREEIDAVVAECGLENYTEVFPRLTRILAFMVFYSGTIMRTKVLTTFSTRRNVSSPPFLCCQNTLPISLKR
jgi:cytochrome P450